MLCPSCGSDVGEELRLCDACQEERAARLAAAKEQQNESGEQAPAQAELSAPGHIEPSAPGHTDPDGASTVEGMPVYHEDGLTLFFNIISTPTGLTLGGVILYLILFLGTVMVFPDKGFIGGGLLALALTGGAVVVAAKYAFMFDETTRRKNAGMVFGYILSAVGVGLYALYTGDGVRDAYNMVEDSMHTTTYEESEYEDY